MLQSIQDLLLSSFKEILSAVTIGVVLFIRAWVQSHVATKVAEDVERDSNSRQANGQDPLQGHEKKAIAMATVQQSLPLGVRPFTTGSLDRLVEKVVPAAKKRVSERPAPPDKKAN